MSVIACIIAAVALAAFHSPTWAWALLVGIGALIAAVES